MWRSTKSSDASGRRRRRRTRRSVAGPSLLLGLFLGLGMALPASAQDVTIEKSTNGQDADAAPGPVLVAGDPVNWTYQVSAGVRDLQNIVVTDDQGVAVSCPQTTLGPGASMTCTASGTVAIGQYANLGTVTAEFLNGVPVAPDSDPSHYFGVAEQALSIEKATEGVDADVPPGPVLPVGGSVNWTYLVTNESSTDTLTNVSVTDDQGVAVSCPKSTLVAGESMTCVGFGTVQSGQYANIGEATGELPGSIVVFATDPSHYRGQALAFQKATNGADADVAPGPPIPVGDPVTWTYQVGNPGPEAISNIVVTDDQGVAVSCPQTSLDPGESMVCTGSGTAVAGPYANVGTATAQLQSGPSVQASDPSHYTGIEPSPITIEKLTNGVDADSAPGPVIATGDAVNWTYEVTNVGSDPLTSVTVTDDQGVAVSCPKTTLAAGESMTCVGFGVAIAGPYENLGTANAISGGSDPVEDSDFSHYFGSDQDIDYGDAPDPTFPTRFASAGASHVLSPTVFLGACVDSELDGQPSVGADSDDLGVGAVTYGTCAVAGDDEDGVTFLDPLVAGAVVNLDVVANAPCTLTAWIDFNVDGDWNEASDALFPGGVALAPGANALNFTVPGDAFGGETYARFRCTTDTPPEGGVFGFFGQADDGEVEDYLVSIELDLEATLVDSPGSAAMPGDTLSYEATVSSVAGSASGVEFDLTLDPNTLPSGGVTTTPLARDDGLYEVDPATPTTIDGSGQPVLLANDFGIPAPSAIESLAQPTALGGTVDIATDGSFTYTPFGGAVGGEIDSFTYDIENGVPSGSPATDTATASLVLGGSPIAVDDNPFNEPAYTIAAGSTLTIIDGPTDPVERNDFPGSPAGSLTSFGGGDLAGAVTDNAAGTTVTPLPGHGDGSLTVNGDGSFTFVTPSSFDGLWQFDYRLTNTSGSSDARVTIEVQVPPDAIDDGPGAAPGDPFATLPDTPIDTTSHPTPSVLANDLLGTPAGGVTFYGTSAAPTTPAEGGPTPTDLGGTVEVSTNGEFLYTPPAGTTGTDAFGYVLANGAGGDSATVMILIASPPTAQDDAITALANSSNSLDAAADNGSGADSFGDPAGAVDLYGPVGGPLTTAPGNPFALPSGNTVNFTGGAGVGTFTYDATVNPTFTGVESFEYQITNVAGSDTAVVTITVQQSPVAVNDAPGMISAPGDAWHTALDTALDSTAHTTPPVLDNDTRGFPLADVSSYGTSASPGDVNVPGAATATDNGGTVQVAADGNFVYTPPSSTFTGPDLFGYTLTNAAGSDDGVVTIAVGERAACANDPDYTAIGNVGITVPVGSGLLANDSGDEIAVASVEGSPANVGVATATDQSGSVTVAADGSFTYTPAAGFNGADTFQYTAGNGFPGAAECTVTITISEVIWFIDNSAAAGGDGTLASPFDALADMGPAADQAGDIIFVDEGQTGPTVPYDGGITLLDNQQLIGQGVDLTTAAGITLPPFSAALPGIATPPSVGNSAGNGINLGNGNNVAGLDAFSGAGSAIAGSSIAAGTFDDITVSQGTASGIDLFNTTGTFTFTDSSINTTNASPAFRMNGGTASVTYNGDITQSSNAALVDISNHTAGTVTFQNGTLSATSGTGLQFSNADGAGYSFSGTTTLNGGDAGIDILGGSAGTFTFGTGTSITSPTGTAFNISGDVGTGAGPPTTFSGSIVQANNAPAAAILNHSGGSSSPVIFDGSSSISATNGTGLQFNNADRVYQFNGPVTLSGGDAGIDILSGSQGTFTFANTTITSPSGTAFNVNGGSATVTYSGGGITQNNAATAYAVTGHFGATHNISVPVTANTSSATGISLAGGSGSVNFSGGVDIDTTGGTGLSVSGGIAASFTGTNTLDTTTGRGIDVNGSTLNSTFNNATVTNGGVNPAVSLVNSPGTKTFNAMNLATTSGAALTGTNAGTLSVTGATNTISTTTGSAISLTNTTIGATDVTFQSVSTDGATTGITLNSTGTSGGLKVTGTGGNCADDTVPFGSRTCTGGVIQNTTTGVSLTSTANVSLSYMRFHNISGDGIVGTGVTDGSGGAENTFEFLNSEMVDIGTDASTDNGIDFGVNTADFTFNISGDVLVDNALFEHDNVPTGTVSGNAFAQSALRIENQLNVTMNLDVTDSVFRETPNNADDAIKVIVGISSTTTVDVMDSVALNVRGALLFLSAEDNSTAADVNFERNEVRNTKTTAATSTAEIGSGVVIAASNGAAVTFDILDNCPSSQAGCSSGSATAGFYRLFGDPIDISANTNSLSFGLTTFEGRIVENRIEDTTGDMIGIFGDAEDGTLPENPGLMRGIVLIDDNVLVGGVGPNGTSGQNGIDVKWRDGANSAAPEFGRELDITITDNVIGSGTPLNDDGINFLDISNQTGSVLTALLVDVLIDNNTISVTDDSAVSLDIEDSGVMNATVTNNVLTTTSASPSDEALELKTDNDAVGNFTITGNSLSTSSTSDIELDHDDPTGTFNVLQADAAAVTAANNSATVNVSDEAITFDSGITPTTPTLPSNP